MYRLNESILQADLDGQQVLLNPETGTYHIVNNTGAALLAAFSRGEDLEEATRGLALAKNVDLTVIEADAADFVSAMLERGLIEEY